MNELRVLLADDHVVVREGLKKLINEHPGMKVIGEAADGLTACHEAVRLQPDVAVMDVSMPNLNGIDATRRLRKISPKVKILALTVHEDLGYLNEMMEAGASGYVLKIAACEELIHALTTVAGGGTYLDPSLAGKVLAKSMNTVPADQFNVKLSPREEAVVRLIAEGHTNKEIAVRLHISHKSVETYKSRSMSKLGFRGRADFVRYALEKGWLRSS